MRLTRNLHHDFVDTVSTRPQGLDSAPRSLPPDRWTARSDFAPEDRGPAFDRMPEPDGWFVAVLGMGCIVAVAVCALLALALA